jgi:hypothetical protein
MFGFSAGAQVVLRHAIFPHYTISPPSLAVDYIISDPSTYLYFTEERVFSLNGIPSVPNRSWVPSAWAVSYCYFNIPIFQKLTNRLG